jgi:transposase
MNTRPLGAPRFKTPESDTEPHATAESPTRARRRADVLTLRKRGMLPMAIADTLGCPDSTVRRILRYWIESGELDPLPRWYEKGSKGWASARAICPCCGRSG